MRDFPQNMQGSRNPGNLAQYSSIAPPKRDAPRGASSCTSGVVNRVYTISSSQQQESCPDFVTVTIKIFTFDVYVLFDIEARLSFLTPDIANMFEIYLEKLCEPYCVSTHVGEPILVERVYRDYPISINHYNTMVDLVELDMVDSDVILGMDLLHTCYALIVCITRVLKMQIPNELVIQWSSS